MANVFDTARYILQKQGPMTAMKLQKLVYYSQAWSLVWDEKPLFNERIEAWVNGPVVKSLFDLHKGQFLVSDIGQGNADNLTDNEKTNINSVLDFYGNKTAQWLSDLTHIEAPWVSARQGLSECDNGNNEITLASMHEYYSSIK